MAKKNRELNIFNVSFLDLLSGALGAVLILFVIVPKMDSTIRQQLEELDTFKKLELEVTDIQQMISQLDNSVSKNVVSDLKNNLTQVSGNIDVLRDQVKQIQSQLSKSEAERVESQEKNKKLQEQVEALKKQMRDENKLVVENKKLQSELDIVQKSEQVIKQQLDALQLQSKDASSAQKQMQTQIEQQKKDLFKCLEDKKAVEDALAEMRAKIEELATQNKQLSEKLSKKTTDQKYVETAVEEMIKQTEKLESENKKLKKENTQIDSKLEKIQKQNEQLEAQLKNAQNELAKKDKEDTGGTKEARTGVKFNDKNIVFIVDVSGSMDDEPEPEKLDQVKAGLKMLVASMDDSYKIDIVIFPKSPTQDWDALYNRLAPVADKQKYAIYRHLAPIYARNCTPTRSVLEHVLTDPAYKDAGTITFLSDGLPTRSVEGSTDCPADPPKDVLKYIKGLNKGKKTINTIGVGEVYRNSASKDPKVTFMQSMAKQNGGCYIGF